MSDSSKFVPVWHNEYNVRSYEIDMHRQIRLPVLCQLFQETAMHHTINLGVSIKDLIKKNMIWILSRQIIHIDAVPKWTDTIRVETWPTENEHYLCFRDFKALNLKGEVTARAMTSWCAIDLQTRRPQPSSSYLPADMPQIAERAFPGRQLKKIESVEEMRFQEPFRVRYSDLDFNMHVGNVKYIEWMIDAFAPDFFRNLCLIELEINYLAETWYGDEIESGSLENRQNQFIHELRRKSDGTVLCRAETKWG
ncbi:MAG: hypothetical protein COT43_10160 [Candidatus Marinimicrobia bacterium CG08_land_8_20_14_0_20_45_22]|nr:MAG: hypothetical protein COT43_10160 [Candidatus Marinimicrobia bacterium CG08_land_8_20_14_0_20_45_22]